MSADTAMKFMVWASYYNEIELSPGKSFTDCSKDGKPMFGKKDAGRLDRLKDALFKCFEPSSVASAMSAMQKAKEYGEPCPFTEESLNDLFGTAL